MQIKLRNQKIVEAKPGDYVFCDVDNRPFKVDRCITSWMCKTYQVTKDDKLERIT